MPHCSGCGQVIESTTAKFCHNCGQVLVRVAPRPSDWSQPIEGIGCASTILATCAILCGLGTIVSLVFAPIAFVEAAGLGISALLSVILLAGLTIVFVRVRNLGLRDDDS